VVDKIMLIIRDELEKTDQLEPLRRRRRLSRVKSWFGFGPPVPLTPDPKTTP
jgi:hypothetical protein